MKVALVKLSNKRKGKFTWCIEINTTDMPRRKLMVKVCPKNAAEARPVNIVATVDEYFFKIVSGAISDRQLDIIYGNLNKKKMKNRYIA
jgi:hypothetical protein